MSYDCQPNQIHNLLMKNTILQQLHCHGQRKSQLHINPFGWLHKNICHSRRQSIPGLLDEQVSNQDKWQDDKVSHLACKQISDKESHLNL